VQFELWCKGQLSSYAQRTDCSNVPRQIHRRERGDVHISAQIYRKARLNSKYFVFPLRALFTNVFSTSLCIVHIWHGSYTWSDCFLGWDRSLVGGTDVSEECFNVDIILAVIVVVYTQRNSRIPPSLRYCKIKLWYFDVLKVVALIIPAFWDFTPCSRGYYCPYIVDTCTLHGQY
jgi:hypothetical protein